MKITLDIEYDEIDNENYVNAVNLKLSPNEFFTIQTLLIGAEENEYTKSMLNDLAEFKRKATR